MIEAYEAASSPNSIRAFKSDLEAFDLWCRRNNRIALPATAKIDADYLDAWAGEGARPASLGRYQASIAKIHQLLDLKDSAQGNQRAFDADGLNQDLFVSGEDLAGIMDALRWKSPLMPLAYNRNLAAEAGVVGRLTKRLE